MRKRKAISPAIVTLLLMAVAIAGGIAVWQSMNSQAQTISKISKLDMVDVSLSKLQVGSKAFFSVTLKNSGTIDFDTIEAGFWDDANKYLSFVKNSANLLPRGNSGLRMTSLMQVSHLIKNTLSKSPELPRTAQHSVWQKLFLLWVKKKENNVNFAFKKFALFFCDETKKSSRRSHCSCFVVGSNSSGNDHYNFAR